MKRTPHFLVLAAVWAAVASATPVRAAQNAPPAGAPILNPSRQKALYLGVIDSLRKDGSARAALAYLDSFDSLYPHDARAQILRADCLVDIGDGPAAEVIYRKAMGGAFADQAQDGLGHIFAARADWAGAAAAFAEAVKRKPAEVPYLNDLGFALLQAGRTDEGVFRLRQALELAPGDVLVRNNLIVALQNAGRSEEAAGLVETIKTPIERAAARAVFAAASPKPSPTPLANGEAR